MLDFWCQEIKVLVMGLLDADRYDHEAQEGPFWGLPGASRKRRVQARELTRARVTRINEVVDVSSRTDLNRPVTVEIDLPLYMVLCLEEDGDLSEGVRAAIRELLRKRGHKWYMPMWLLRVGLPDQDLTKIL